ncbi:MAG: ABC transporter substrate-binding protein [bacterium]|nr:ABC transporter substrate-binding protein [bacterium]MCY3951908.1 ABC transporter substrate-binding protein [bacterium]
MALALLAAACASDSGAEDADAALTAAQSARGEASTALADAAAASAAADAALAAAEAAQAAADLAQATATGNAADVAAAEAALADAQAAADSAREQAAQAEQEAADARAAAAAAEEQAAAAAAAEAAPPPPEPPPPPPEDDMDDATTVINVAILSDCEGAFGAFHDRDIAGVVTAFAEHAGATVNDRTAPQAGWSNASINGIPVELVGIGCADDTAEAALRETRRLMEDIGADIMIGPLSGDESIAVANYAKDHPDQTFVNGTSGAQDSTMAVRAPNFFRFNGDGAQWNAGLGDIAHNVLGWETAAVIGDDYSFAWTSTAGFIAEFCAAGGDVISRVYPPLNTTDYSGFVEQLPGPDEVDGYFWAVGGAGLVPALNAFEDAKGEIVGDQHMGNLFWGIPDVFRAIGPRVVGSYSGGFGNAPDLQTEKAAAFRAIINSHFDEIPFGGAPAPADAAYFDAFFMNYYNNAWGLIEGLKAVGGDISGGQRALQAAIGEVVLDAAFGEISLDSNRTAIQDQYVGRIYMDDNGEMQSSTVAFVPQVDQTFGGTFTGDPPPSRDFPPCEVRDLPWIGNATPVVDGVLQN